VSDHAGPPARGQQRTNADRGFEQWFADCAESWDMTIGEDADNYPWLAWREWYDSGLTVEEAVGRANEQVFGWR